MPELGNKLECFECGTKFYDLGKPDPTCPKCGTDQRNLGEDKPAAPAKTRRPVAEPVSIDEDLEEPLGEEEAKGTGVVLDEEDDEDLDEDDD